MKKAYIVPTAKYINLAFEGLVAQSGGGLDDGDSVENAVPTSDNSDNFYSNRRNNIWGEKY